MVVFLLSSLVAFPDIQRTNKLGVESFNEVFFVIESKYRIRWSDQWISTVEWRADPDRVFREISTQFRFSDETTIYLGRQVRKWGFIDLLRGVDDINPLDNRDPGRRDLHLLRLPLWMTGISHQLDGSRIDLSVIHEFRQDRFDPDFPIAPNPDYSSNNQGFAARWLMEFESMDIEWSYLDHYDLEQLVPKRQQRVGVASQYLLDDQVLKAEIASDQDEVVGALGMDWFIDSSSTLIVEARHQDSQSEFVDDLTTYIIQYLWDSDADDIHVSILYSENDIFGAFQRAEVTWDVNDSFSLTVGGLVFQNGENILASDLESDDALFFKAHYFI